MTAGFVLSGMSSGWSEARPGRLIHSLAQGKRANPLIVLDELCKSGGDKRYSTLDPLHQLLEKDTAAVFVNEALEISTNCSHIVWIATANRLDALPNSIISRFTILDIKPPTHEEMKNVLKSIYQKIRRNHKWGERFTEELSPSVTEKIIESNLEPRVIQRQLISAAGSAALRNRGQSVGQHVILADNFTIPENNKKTRMGYL